MQFLYVFLLARARSPIAAVTDHGPSSVDTVSPQLVAKAKRGLDLPTVTADGLRSCRARVNSTTLLGCALLLPAGTGTRSLHELMATVLGSARSTVYAHHRHSVRMTASWWKQYRQRQFPQIRGPAVPAPKCYIMSLRDPAARLRSGFAFMSRHGWCPGLSQTTAWVKKPSAAAMTYRGFVSAMRDPENRDHRWAQAIYGSSVSIQAGTGAPVSSALPRCAWGILIFLVSQLDYLRGWEGHCLSRSRGELHFMCAA